MDVPAFLFTEEEIKKLTASKIIGGERFRKTNTKPVRYFQMKEKDFDIMTDVDLDLNENYFGNLSEAAVVNKTLVVRLISVAFNLASKTSSIESRLSLIATVAAMAGYAPTEARRLLAYVR